MPTYLPLPASHISHKGQNTVKSNALRFNIFIKSVQKIKMTKLAWQKLIPNTLILTVDKKCMECDSVALERAS